ncbi:MAG: hypothetical protein GY711_09395 [bacterium]|nr:hypothetical protein [bacterium]
MRIDHSVLRLSLAVALASALTAGAHAQLPNDDCATAAVAQLGPNNYTTVGSMNSAPVWPCGAGARDVWFRFTVPNDAGYVFDTCAQNNHNSVLQVFSGTCAALVSEGCSNDACGSMSQVLLPNATAGTEYLMRIGGFIGSQGTGILTVTEVPSLTPLSNQDECGSATVDTLTSGEYSFDNSGATTGVEGQVDPICYQFGVGGIQSDIWAVYVSDTNGEAIIATCGSLGPSNDNTKLAAYPLAPCSTIDGTAVACDDNSCFLLSEIRFPVGCGESYLVQIGSFPGSSDGTAGLSITETGTPCAPGAIGSTPDACNPPVPNSTGQPAEIAASGSLSLADMDVRLTVDNVPAGQFGYFFTAQGLSFVPAPGGSAGNLCVVGNYGRYIDASQLHVGQGVGSPVPAGGLQVGNIAVPQNPPLPAFTPETWYFQAWNRDGATSNFSNVVRLAFTP